MYSIQLTNMELSATGVPTSSGDIRAEYNANNVLFDPLGKIKGL
jgi:hypothetical protein